MTSSTGNSRRSSNKVQDLITKFSELSATSETFDFPSYELATASSRKGKKAGLSSTTNHHHYFERAPELVQCGDSSAGSLSFVSNSTCTDVVDDESSTTQSMSYFEVYAQDQEAAAAEGESINDTKKGGNTVVVNEDDDEVSIQNIEELLLSSHHSKRGGGGHWDDEEDDEESPSKRGSSTVRFADYNDVYDVERFSESIAEDIFYNDEEYSQFMMEAYDEEFEQGEEDQFF